MKVKDIKIAYIGGGSRGWAWGLMSDLAINDDMEGSVYLYDIDFDAAKSNEIIGNRIKDLPDCKSKWEYKAVETIEEALTGANFVVISILPGTFDEMHSDVHAPEKYNIYQPVGDTTGPGGIIRALRTVPMFEVIGEAIKKYSPDAWVINYTNPMALCVKTLYRVFPEIKAFGCCHEVFGTQKLLCKVLEENGIEGAERSDIKTEVTGVNHFTWLTSAQYKTTDIFPLYKEFCETYVKVGFFENSDQNWINSMFSYGESVKMDLFLRYGLIAAAGDRHLAEFCEGKWYLESPERVREMHFNLTDVDWRKGDLVARIEKGRKLASGEMEFELSPTGEEGVNQMRALLGLADLVTNVNIPNRGQIPNMPMGAVVETNAVFTSNRVTPVYVGNVPEGIYPLVSRIAGEQVMVDTACANRDLKLAFKAFVNDQLVTCPIEDAKKLFVEMVNNTKEYLTEYDVASLTVDIL